MNKTLLTKTSILIQWVILFSFLAETALAQQKNFGKRTPNAASITIENQTAKSPSTSLISRLNTLKVTRNPENGSVLMIENFAKGKPTARTSMQAMATAFLNQTKQLLQLNNPEQELELVTLEIGENGTNHLKFQQKYQNVPIYGGEMWLHSNGEKIDVLNGRNFPTPQLNTTKPSISAEKAIELAMQDVSNHAIVQKSEIMQKLLKSKESSAELIIYHKDEKLDNEQLAYHLTIKPNILERWVYFVDAISGNILDKYNYTCTLDGTVNAQSKDLNGIDRAFKAYQYGSQYIMMDISRPMFKASASSLPNDPAGAIWTIDAKNSTVDDTQYQQIATSNPNAWNATSVSAHYNAGICYDYYRTKHARNSLDNKGSSIISVINITDENGKGFDNAFWNGEYMAYGNGGTYFRPLAGALDVAGHEMTHGVVESTARLEYRSQSGALNESFADVFGALIDRDDWKMGEDIVKSGFPSGALRSLENPNQGGKSDPGYQPKTMSQYVVLQETEEEDNGGVHINSGIPNYAFYLFATKVGKDVAEKVYYEALTKYLFRTAKFVDARLAIVKAAEAAGVADAAKAAFDAVGIADPSSGGGNPTPTPPTQTLPTNTGGDYILYYDPVAGTLKTGTVGSTSYRAISNRGCINKPSITDDGLFAYFVGTDKHIYRIALSGTFTETKLSSNPEWGNVAVSKDGKRLAARRYVDMSSPTATEKYIYIFNLQDGNGKGFELYNPTYSTGVKSGDIRYPDALEWDYTNERVVYDAYNTLKSTSGTIAYWDVGILQAWNLSTNTYGTGKIEKLFTDLEKGESIGNPAFAKNSPTIMTFDYYHEIEKPDTYTQIALDISRNDGYGEVFNNSEIGYPNYSRTDEYIIFNAKSQSGKSVVAYQKMNADKIHTSGSPSVLIADAMWGVWYSQGQRNLPTKTDQTVTFDAVSDKAPNQTFTINAKVSSGLPVQYSVVSGDATINGNQVKTGTTPGKVTLKAFQVGNAQYNAATATITFCIVPNAPTLTSNGGSLVASGGTNYQWYVNGSPVGGQTTANTRTPDLGGSWTVRAITADGCTSAVSNAISYTPLANETSLNVSLVLYPNPTSRELKIELPVGAVFKEARFYSVEGKESLKISSLNESNTLNISTLPQGSYTLAIETSKGKVVKRIVVE